MLQIPILRWGEPYDSLETDEVLHFATGEPVAKVSRANSGLIARDVRKSKRARDVLREIPPDDLVDMVCKAADLYLHAELPMGDGTQTPDDFIKAQSATTGLPEVLCRNNMVKNHFVMTEMRKILASLTRGLDLNVLGKGYGRERDVTISYQANSSVVGLVLPSNSPGVHTLWLPVIPMQVGLMMKPGSSEPWTPYRIVQAFYQAGIPREAISVYPGSSDVGGAILEHSQRSMIFGGQQTIDKYAHNPRVQAHGPGFSKILFGEDKIDDWEKYLDLMFDSVCANSGRSCINCSSIWVPRHGREIAEALARRMIDIPVLPHDHPDAKLAAFTISGVASSINDAIDGTLNEPNSYDVTAKLRDGSRLIQRERHDFLLPTTIFAASPAERITYTEYMFPYVTVVECKQAEMLSAIGPTLVCTALTDDSRFRQDLLDATHIDRLNLGAVPTMHLNWLQPHEGNIVEFLFRNRALQFGE